MKKSEDISGYRTINQKKLFSDLPPDISVYGCGSPYNILGVDINITYVGGVLRNLNTDKSSVGKILYKNKPDENIDFYTRLFERIPIPFPYISYDEYIINQPIFFLNKQINLDDTQLIKQIALESHIQKNGKEDNPENGDIQFENYICPSEIYSSIEKKSIQSNKEYEKTHRGSRNGFYHDNTTYTITRLGIGPNIITRVKFLVNVFNSRIKHKEDEQYIEQSKQEQLIHNITSIIAQQFKERLENQSTQFKERLDNQSMQYKDKLDRLSMQCNTKMDKQSTQLKEVVERIQVLEKVVFRKTNDIKHDLVDIHHHIASIGEEILEKVNNDI